MTICNWNFVSFWHNWLLLSKIIWRLTIWVNQFFRKIPTLSKLFKSKCYPSEILKTLDGRWALGVVIRWLRNFYQTTYTADGQKILTTNTAWGIYKNSHNGLFLLYGQVNILSSTIFNEKGPFFKKYIKKSLFIFDGRVIHFINIWLFKDVFVNLIESFYWK